MPSYISDEPMRRPAFFLFVATSLCVANRLVAQDPLRLRACLDSCTEAKEIGDYEAALRHADMAFAEASALGDTIAMPTVLVRRSELRQYKGDFFGALTDLYDALRLYEKNKDEDGLATVYNHIGAVHHYDRNYAEAGRFYASSLAIRERQGNQQERALLYGNIGSLLEDLGRPDSALAYHRRNLQIRRTLGDGRWIGISLSNLGSCFEKSGQPDSARHYLEAGLAFIRKEPGEFLLGQTLTMLGKARLRAGALREALAHCTAGLRIAERLRTLPQQEACFDCLYRANSALGRTSEALIMLERLTAARDSMFGRERAKGLVRLELNYAFERQQYADSLRRLEEKRLADIASEQRVSRERDQKRLFLFSSIGVLLLAIGLWSRLRFMRRSRSLVRKERDRSESLLLNILPKPIADELKANGRAAAREVDGVSILFTDFHDFTRMSERLSAHELVAEIDACFRAFDGIAAKRGLEKIKTIGDAYICLVGLPEPRRDSARDTVLAALDMQDWLKARAQERTGKGLPFFTMRAGIHTGPVVAGIVGDSKFQYDIWGDTVNTAAHMESAGAVGEVNISEATFNLLKDEPGLSFSPRGRVAVKSKGEMAMFFARRRDGTARTGELPGSPAPL